MTTRFKKFIAAAISAAMVMSSFAVFAANDGVLPKDEVIQSEETAEPETTASLETPDMSVWDIPTTFNLDSEAAEPMALSADVTASGKCGDNLTWTLDSSGTLTISGTGDMYEYFRSSISETTTASWGDYNDNLKKLIINDGVTSIGDFAFCGCSSFTGELVIPDSVISIGERAFDECSGFDGNLVIGNGVTSIGICAFTGCSGFMGDLVIPNSVTSIGEFSFQYCKGFTGNLVIGNGVTSIERNAFAGCSGFTGELVIPDSITSIENGVFSYCRSFTGSLIIPDSVTSIGDCAFQSCSGFTGDLVISNSIKSIPFSAFMDCTGFTGNLIIPDSVTSIDEQAFYHCSGFTGDLIIPEGVTSIGSLAFCQCRGINNMYIPQNEDSMLIGSFPNRVHWKYDLSKCSASIKGQFIYTGNAIIPEANNITVTSPNGKTLYYGTDYVITGANNNTSVGTATAHIAPPEGGISIMSQDVPFNIIGIDISGAAVTFPEDITYQGEPCCPEPTVVVNGMTLTKGTDYTVEYSDNNAVGTGKAKIKGIGNYIGSVNAEFEIGPYKPGDFGNVDISKDFVEVSIDGNFVYNGTEHTPKPKLVYHFTNPTTGITLDYDMVEGTDYEIVSYTNNIDAGIATMTIAGIGTFERKRDIDFSISPCELSATTIADIPSVEYCKKDICPDPEIKIDDKVMVKDVDYELSYENNRNRGTATVTITGKGNLTGVMTKTFEIAPRDGTKFTIVIWL